MRVACSLHGRREKEGSRIWGMQDCAHKNTGCRSRLVVSAVSQYMLFLVIL